MSNVYGLDGLQGNENAVKVEIFTCTMGPVTAPARRLG
jgi:hypothetical protein